MGTAVDSANLNGILGMIVAIENTTPYGPPDFCLNPPCADGQRIQLGGVKSEDVEQPGDGCSDCK